MKKMTIMVLILLTMVVSACGKEEAMIKVPALSLTQAKEQLEGFMWIKGYSEKFPIVEKVEHIKKKDGKPAMIFTMTDQEKKEKRFFIVSVNQNEWNEFQKHPSKEKKSWSHLSSDTYEKGNEEDMVAFKNQ